MDASQLAQRVLARERSAVGLALSQVEDRRSRALETTLALLEALRQHACQERSIRIGFTGPPGVGKSSLVAAVARHLRTTGRTVGILAVDPTSPHSGGALLGDRARIDPDAEDDGLFVRSMASGGDMGGLSRAALAATEVLAASHDVVLIETVGVGQSETDVEFVADVTAVVLQPASGDTLQFLKAGILEIPDVFVVNKIDLGDVAKRTLRELVSTLHVARAARHGSVMPQVIETSATSGLGIDRLVQALDGVYAELRRTEQLSQRRTLGSVAWAERLLVRRVGELGVERLGGRRSVREQLMRDVQSGVHGLAAVQRCVTQALQQFAQAPV